MHHEKKKKEEEKKTPAVCPISENAVCSAAHREMLATCTAYKLRLALTRLSSKYGAAKKVLQNPNSCVIITNPRKFPSLTTGAEDAHNPLPKSRSVSIELGM